METDRDLYVCGTHALAFYLSPKSKRLDKAFEERIARGLPPGQLPNFVAYAGGAMPRPALHSLPLQAYIPKVSSSEARELREFFGAPLPLNVMVSGKNQRRFSARTCSWEHPAAVPRNSYLRLSKSVFLAVPELAALQVTQSYCTAEFAVLVSMLCAFFVESAEAPGGLMPRRAPSTLETFGTFLASLDPAAPTPRGTRRLQRALRYAMPNAASPAEIQLALVLSLPKSLGGYGFPKPQLNEPCGSGEASALYPDLLWRKKHVAVEYQSEANHLGSEQLRRDLQRSNLLQSAGITLFEASARHLRDPHAMEELACMIAKKLGVSVELGQTARAKRAQLNTRLEKALDHFGKLWL